MKTVLNAVSRLYARARVLKNSIVRQAIALAWTLYVTVLLEQSSGHPMIGEKAPPGPPSTDREMLLTLGHLVVFSLLVIVWQWALRSFRPVRRALFVATAFALIFGVVSELAQFGVPDRSVSAGDMAANLAASAGTYLLLRRLPI